MNSYINEWFNKFPASVTPYELREDIIHEHLRDFEEGDIEDRLYKFTEYQKMKLPTDKLRIQWYVDEDKVKKYEKRIQKGEFPRPIIYDKVRKSVIDGTHRLVAFKNLGFPFVVCYVGLSRFKA